MSGPIDEMGYEALSRVRESIRVIGGDNIYAYETLEGLVPFLACWQFGHPRQPRHFLSRFRQRPWRCERCETWWITRRVNGNPWAWRSAGVGQASDD